MFVPELTELALLLTADDEIMVITEELDDEVELDNGVDDVTELKLVDALLDVTRISELMLELRSADELALSIDVEAFDERAREYGELSGTLDDKRRVLDDWPANALELTLAAELDPGLIEA